MLVAFARSFPIEVTTGLGVHRNAASMFKDRSKLMIQKRADIVRWTISNNLNDSMTRGRACRFVP